MIITYHSAACFKIQFGETTLAFNPVSKQSQNYKPVKFKADIALVSAVHPDFNGVEQVSGGRSETFVIRGPGEYEINGVTVRGYRSESGYGGIQHNTIYVVELEGMTICFLGALNNQEVPPELREVLEEVDLLFTPIAGDGVLDASSAYKLAVGLEPKLIIPMLYDVESGQGDGLAKFLEEGGGDKAEPKDKLTVKPKDLAGRAGEIAVLRAQ